MLTVIAVVSMTACMMFSMVVTNCHHSIDTVKNSTTTVGALCSREIYEVCLCDTVVNLTHNPDNCLSNLQLLSARTLPLVSYVVQFLSVRELFTLVADCKHTIARVAWALSPFILIAIRLAIYADKCYHLFTITFLFFTSGVLMMFVFRELQLREDDRNFRRDRNMLPVVHQAQPAHYNCTGA